MEKRFETFTVLIAHLSRSIRRIKSEEMAKLHLRSYHLSCLYYLYRGESLTATELCEVCEEDKANVSRAVEYLEQEGYLVSRPKTQRRYKTPLELTEKGKAVGRALCEKINTVLLQAGEGLTEEARRVMYESLAAVSANLQRVCDGYDGETEPNREPHPTNLTNSIASK